MSVIILAIGVVVGAVILSKSNQPVISSQGRETNFNVTNANANVPYQRVNRSPTIQQQPEPQANQPNSLVLLSQVFEVSPQQYFTTTFTVPNSGARIVGRFQAVSGDNIQVHILGPDDYSNFEHRNPFRTYYDSGKTVTGSIDLRLGGGTYYLVFENRYSIFSKKVVQANVSMEY
ncbi:MAG TPA: hypothetical protein VLJ61_01510 [Pyrinomonadaceae bacterium]|nr:hypothetical protein [Pyrinomonadaceae bacterium]